MKFISLYIYLFFCNFVSSYSQMKQFQIPKTLYAIDSSITIQKLNVYNIILDSINKEFRSEIQNNKFLVNIDFRFDKYESYVGYAGKFLQKEINVEDSICLKQIKFYYKKKISDSSLFFTNIGRPYSIREVLIASSFFKPVLEKRNNFYIEINAPIEGWDALYLNSLCKYLDDITKSDFYSKKYYFHKSEKIYIPVYIYGNKLSVDNELLRLYIFTFKNVENKVQIKFNGFMPM